MNREELIRKIDETILAISPDTNICEELADLIEQEKKDEVIRFLEWMAKRGGSAFVCTYDEIYNDFKEATKQQ